MKSESLQAPGSVRPLFPCCGGPVGTMDRCMCMVDPNEREQAGEIKLESLFQLLFNIFLRHLKESSSTLSTKALRWRLLLRSTSPYDLPHKSLCTPQVPKSSVLLLRGRASEVFLQADGVWRSSGFVEIRCSAASYGRFAETWQKCSEMNLDDSLSMFVSVSHQQTCLDHKKFFRWEPSELEMLLALFVIPIWNHTVQCMISLDRTLPGLFWQPEFW